jgi:hypothetical protein
MLVESLGILQQTGDKPMIAAALHAATRVASALGRWTQAARLAGATAARREASGVPAPPAEDEMQRQMVIAAVAALDEATVATAFAAGRALPPDHAIAEALALVDSTGA